MEPDQFVKAVSDLVIRGSLEAQAIVLREAERVFRSEGYARRFAEWETDEWWHKYFGDASA